MLLCSLTFFLTAWGCSVAKMTSSFCSAPPSMASIWTLGLLQKKHRQKAGHTRGLQQQGVPEAMAVPRGHAGPSVPPCRVPASHSSSRRGALPCASLAAPAPLTLPLRRASAPEQPFVSLLASPSPPAPGCLLPCWFSDTLLRRRAPTLQRSRAPASPGEGPACPLGL